MPIKERKIQPSLIERRPREARALRVLLVVAMALLGIGVVMPMMTVEQFFIFENRFSLLSGLQQMTAEGRWGLLIIVVGFSVLLPLLKLATLALILSPRATGLSLHRCLHWMHLYGKWSMLDVFVVAVLLVAVKLGVLATVELHVGLYAFAASVLLTMAVTARVTHLTQDPGGL